MGAVFLIIGYAAVLYIGYIMGDFMADKRNERTGKDAAAKAARLMRVLGNEIDNLHRLGMNMAVAIESAIDALEMAKSVAASALTQAPDKKKKK